MKQTTFEVPAFAARANLGLTRRELEVLCLLLGGHALRDAGKRLNLRRETVKCHCRSLYSKLHVNNRQGLGKAVIARIAPGANLWRLLEDRSK